MSTYIDPVAKWAVIGWLIILGSFLLGTGFLIGRYV